MKKGNKIFSGTRAGTMIFLNNEKPFQDGAVRMLNLLHYPIHKINQKSDQKENKKAIAQLITHDENGQIQDIAEQTWYVSTSTVVPDLDLLYYHIKHKSNAVLSIHGEVSSSCFN